MTAASQRVEVAPEVVRWACRRAGHDLDKADAGKKPPPGWVKLASSWAERTKTPTLKQLLGFARSAHIPIDHLLGTKPPPPDRVPLPDLRTLDNREVGEPSLELLDTVHICERRREWYSEYLLRTSNMVCDFVGSARLEDSPRGVAEQMRERFQLPEEPEGGSWEGRIQLLVDRAESIGILALRNSMVGFNTRRMLDPQEFRGFALPDERAPLVFINAADSKGAQMFTFAHEVAHLWLGEKALSGSLRPDEDAQPVEQWCNAVAAEFLVPGEDIRARFDAGADLREEMRRLSRRYGVSGLVILIRLKTLRQIGAARFRAEYDREKERLEGWLRRRGGGSGGDTHSAAKRSLQQAGRPLALAVLASVREEALTYREAYRLLSAKNTAALRRIAELVGAKL